jgi:spermidine synthase
LSALFEEIDYRETRLGPISLRRRRVLSLNRDVFEVMLGDEHLMSSLFTEGEIALADLGLAAANAPALDVIVGGLGLGYTARAALDYPGVRSVVVVEAMEAVIDWHRRGLVPLGDGLAADPRCRLVHGDFFASMSEPGDPGAKVDAVLLDIDHSPRALLNAGNAAFYTVEGLGGVAARLVPGGIFALWSDTAPDPEFEAIMAKVFVDCKAEVVSFDNPLTGGKSSCTIYIGRARLGVPT